MKTAHPKMLPLLAAAALVVAGSLAPFLASAYPIWGGNGTGTSGTVTSITSPNGSITVGGTSAVPTVDLALGHTNTWTVLQGFNGGITESGTNSTASGSVAKNLFYIAPNPAGANSTTWTAASASVQYNAGTHGTGEVDAVKGVAEVFGGFATNIVAGVTGVAQVDTGAANYGASDSLYGLQGYYNVLTTGTFNHAIGLKIQPPHNNGTLAYGAGIYIADNTNAGSGTTTTADALHIEGHSTTDSGTTNAIGFGNGTSGINAYIYSPSANTLAINATSGLTVTGPVTANITSGTFAGKPAAATAGAAGMYYATDLGNYGCMLVSNGTVWKPAGGRCTVYQNWAATSTITSNAETNVISAPIPAGIPNAFGCLEVHAQYAFTGGNNTRNMTLRYGGAACTPGSACALGTAVGTYSAQASSVLSTTLDKFICNRTADVTHQVSSSLGNTGFGTSGGSAVVPGVNSATAVWVNVDCSMTNNSTDTCAGDGATIEWIE